MDDNNSTRLRESKKKNNTYLACKKCLLSESYYRNDLSFYDKCNSNKKLEEQNHGHLGE